MELVAPHLSTMPCNGHMTIAELLRSIKVKRVDGSLDKEIKGLAYDSRLVKKGFLFVAIRGFSVDGHNYLKESIDRGAAGVIVEKAVYLQNKTTVIQVEDSRRALALLSAVFYGEPSQKLSLIGITGTNGKTTTGYIVKSILEAWGEKTGLLGTIQYITGKKILIALNTTPESLDLQRYLNEMVDNDMEFGVLEVSSHALALKRIEGCSLKVAVFTNFSQDHLDFHNTMQKYFAAKSTLFKYLRKDGFAVLNWDDPMIKKLTEKLKCRVITCGIEKGALVRAKNITEHGTMGLSFEIQTPDEKFTVKSELIGRNNIYNILMSVGTAYALGVPVEAMSAGIRGMRSIEGRFEKVEEGQEFLCIVDYAHTEDALKKLVEESRMITRGRIITVFGCGGDRDRGKRPKMGAVAADLSDIVIVTTDNPRTEEPMEIIREIIQGIRTDNYIVEIDRVKAIERAVSMAQAGDTVLIAGKGHENYQEIKGVRYPFSDKNVLREALKKNGYFTGKRHC